MERLAAASKGMGCVTMHFTFTASADGSRLVKCAHWIIASGSFRSMATRTFGASGHNFVLCFNGVKKKTWIPDS
ncbi:hypothetical protein OIU79_012308 [Salix purpurea]|uniref:Uncharacterized protein n=2 Tax=Salix TaxID=40685 RepID=A0A9Q0Q2V1_SALPP|nr:hypothetical protein OIU79_012308 [Salix purpurea]KAJ6746537.1 hypothetical protein OIU74_029084 [Salix koriyanagi]